MCRPPKPPKSKRKKKRKEKKRGYRYLRVSALSNHPSREKGILWGNNNWIICQTLAMLSRYSRQARKLSFNPASSLAFPYARWMMILCTRSARMKGKKKKKETINDHRQLRSVFFLFPFSVFLVFEYVYSNDSFRFGCMLTPRGDQVSNLFFLLFFFLSGNLKSTLVLSPSLSYFGSFGSRSIGHLHALGAHPLARVTDRPQA